MAEVYFLSFPASGICKHFHNDEALRRKWGEEKRVRMQIQLWRLMSSLNSWPSLKNSKSTERKWPHRLCVQYLLLSWNWRSDCGYTVQAAIRHKISGETSERWLLLQNIMSGGVQSNSAVYLFSICNQNVPSQRKINFWKFWKCKPPYKNNKTAWLIRWKKPQMFSQMIVLTVHGLSDVSPK